MDVDPSDSSSFQPYKLSCSLIGHSKDVRCLDSFGAYSSSGGEPGTSSSSALNTQSGGPDGIVLFSGSRDFSARQWRHTAPKGFEQDISFAGHGNFVSSICVVPANKQCDQPLVATGCTDSSIRLFAFGQKQPVAQLIGHSSNVSSLRAGSRGIILSGSWDSTVKQWLNHSCVQTMAGHEAAVWDVEIMEESGQILSASADKSIKSWSSGKCLQTFLGHTDCVRGLAVLSHKEFVSCANDATLRRWSLIGDCLQVFYGHTNFIYAVKSFNGLVFTASEDKSVKVWNPDKSNDPLQSIALPAQSLWCLTVISNGDFAVGCSDASIRVFTNNENRVCSDDEAKLFSEEVSTSSIPSKSTIGDLKMDELPGPEALLQPGKKEGQSLMVREGKDLAFCYQWSSASQKWEKIGQILGGSGGTQVTSGKQLYRGKEYDYVFSVQLDEDKDELKLPYNVTQDPWHAARQFILDNELDPLFLDQVANFIINNTKGEQLGRSIGNVDPFTGNTDDRNDSDPQSITGASFGAQNFSVSSNGPGTNMGNVDPYTGYSATQNGTTSSNEFYPLKDYLVIFKPNIAKDVQKINEFKSKTQTSTEFSNSTFDEFKQLAAADSESCQINKKSMSEIVECLLTWEVEFVFPLFDICVQFANSKSFCESLKSKLAPILSRIASFAKSSSKPTQTMAMRFLANFSGSTFGCEVLAGEQELMTVIEAFAQCEIAPVTLALCTLLLNLSVFAHKEKREMDYISLVAVFVHILSRPVSSLDEESSLRALVAVGTLCSQCEILVEALKSSNMMLIVQNLEANSGSSKVKKCCSHLKLLF